MAHVATVSQSLRLAGLGALLFALAGCATPVTKIEPTPDDTVYTASGRYPANGTGILVAQNAALTEGRQLCEKHGRRFRPLASIAGEDGETGEAVYAVRFRCILGRTLQAPLPSAEPGASGRM